METQNDTNIQGKSVKVAYVLWFFLGGLGAHRFYTGKWLSGFFYLISLGIFGIGWLLDVFFIPSMVRESNRRLEKMLEHNPELLKEDLEIAEWSHKKGFGVYLEFPFRLMFYCFAPLIFAFFALGTKHYELIVIMVVIVIVTSFSHFAKKLLVTYPSIENLPVIGEAFSVLKNLNQFYLENKPRNFLFYAGYLVFGTIMLPFSKSARREFLLYQKIIVTVVIVVATQVVLSYFDVYPPYLGVYDALTVVIMEFFAVFILVIAFMMPVTTTSFYLNLSGRKKMLRLLTFIALFSTFAGVAAHFAIPPSMSLVSNQLIIARMKKAEFTRDLCDYSEMFLQHHMRKNSQKDQPEAVAETLVSRENDLTEKYRDHISGLAKNDEILAFYVVSVIEPQQKLWYGVYFRPSGQANQPICFVDSETNFYTTWDSLPENIQKLFHCEGNVNDVCRIKDFSLVDDQK